MPFGDTPAFDRGIDRGVMMPVGELITSAISNKGNPTGFGQDNTFRVQNAQEVRIVDNKGNVLFSGIGPDAARQAVALGQSISDEKGNKAGWTIQTGERTINTDGSVGPMRYYDVANEKVNKSVLGKIADIALPVAASFIPGVGPVLGAAIGSTASSVAQGRSLENTLLRAGLAAGGSALGGQVFGGVAPGSDAAINAAVNSAVQNAVNAGAQAGASALGSVYGSALGGAAGSAAGSVAGSATGGLIDDIIVTALQKSAPSATGGAIGAAATSLIPSPFDSAQLSNVAPAQTQPEPVTETQAATTPPPLEAGPEIVATAQKGAQIPVVPPLIPDVAPLEKFTPTEEILKDVAMGPENKSLLDRLTANMGLTDYLTAASLLGSAIGGGGGRGATAMPYTSPFGAGVGFGTGRDYRVNPNISDYERYGFGPEATFFAPGYSQLVSGAAGAPAATTMGPQGAMVNPQYVPLI